MLKLVEILKSSGSIRCLMAGHMDNANLILKMMVTYATKVVGRMA